MEFKFGRVLLSNKSKTYVATHLLHVYGWLIRTHKIGQRGGKRVRIIVRDFDLIKEYYQDKVKPYRIVPLFIDAQTKHKYYGIRLFDSIELIDMIYKYGSNELSNKEIFESELEFHNIRSGFNSCAKKKMKMDLIKKEFPPITKEFRAKLIDLTVKGPTIGCRPNIEFTYCSFWDIKSAYPYWILTLEFPYQFIKTTKLTRALHTIHFGKFTLKNFKAKHSYYLPLFLKGGGLDKTDKGVLTCNRRILGGEEYSGYGFLEDLIPIIKNNYDFEELKLDTNELWVAKTKPMPEETKAAVIEMFNKKEASHKHSDKLILNRSAYGLFITHKITKNGERAAADYEVPYQVGTYIVSHQAWYMDYIIQKCGVDHLIKTHTDSIGFDYDISPIIYEENNKRHFYKNIGIWESEKIDKCCYYSNTRAKLLNKEGKLEIKHGGISQNDVDEFLRNNTYSLINEESEIMLTRRRSIEVNEKGTFIKLDRIPIKFNSDLEEGL